MGAILVRIGNASRQPLNDTVDIQVSSTETDTTVARVHDIRGDAAIRFENLTQGRPYLIKVFPMRHRPVAQFAIAGSDADPTTVQLHTPLHPERVRAATFPEYGSLPPELQRVLEQSTVEGVAGSGAQLYAALPDTHRAGLLNLFAKMSSFGFGDNRTVWTFVDRLFRVRADRIFVDVQPALRDAVKSAVASDRAREVSGSLHTPPPGYCAAGSFKTADQYGNLQLTFFASEQPPLTFKVDADIDDAAGLGHAFQVLRNWVTSGTTHPYDIHQILVFRQEAALPYELA